MTKPKIYPLWALVWSPEGRVIAEKVEAPNSARAIRKAPKPYRRYLGEIYAIPQHDFVDAGDNVCRVCSKSENYWLHEKGEK